VKNILVNSFQSYSSGKFSSMVLKVFSSMNLDTEQSESWA